MQTKRWFKEYGASTAWVLRLAESYKNTGRIIHADASFASVNSLVAAYVELKVFFNGMIKSCHKEYPLEYFYDWHEELQKGSNNRGKFLLLQSEYSIGKPMHAVGWYDRTLKTIITNVGTSLAGRPSIRTRHRKGMDTIRQVELTQRYEISVQRPYFIELLYKYFSCVDIHDHYRQGSLALHNVWKTKTWWHRLFSTIFGMLVVDSFYYYLYQCKYKSVADNKILNFPAFLDNIAYNLIFNKFKQQIPQAITNENPTGYNNKVNKFITI